MLASSLPLLPSSLLHHPPSQHPTLPEPKSKAHEVLQSFTEVQCAACQRLGKCIMLADNRFHGEFLSLFKWRLSFLLFISEVSSDSSQSLDSLRLKSNETIPISFKNPAMFSSGLGEFNAAMAATASPSSIFSHWSEVGIP